MLLPHASPRIKLGFIRSKRQLLTSSNTPYPISDLNGITTETYEFDREGRLVYQRVVQPFADLSASSTTSTFEYKGDLLMARTETVKSEPIDPKSEVFARQFGSKELIRVYRYFYDDSARLTKAVQYEKGGRDSTITLYTYDDSLLTESTHYSTHSEGEQSHNNYKISYYYDDHGRLQESHKSVTALDNTVKTAYSYDGSSDRVLSKKTTGYFRYVLNYPDPRETARFTVHYDSTYVYEVAYRYDAAGNTTRQTHTSHDTYRGETHVYEDGLLVESVPFYKYEQGEEIKDRKSIYHHTQDGIITKWIQLSLLGEIHATRDFTYEVYD